MNQSDRKVHNPMYGKGYKNVNVRHEVTYWNRCT